MFRHSVRLGPSGTQSGWGRHLLASSLLSPAIPIPFPYPGLSYPPLMVIAIQALTSTSEHIPLIPHCPSWCLTMPNTRTPSPQQTTPHPSHPSPHCSMSPQDVHPDPQSGRAGTPGGLCRGGCDQTFGTWVQGFIGRRKEWIQEGVDVGRIILLIHRTPIHTFGLVHCLPPHLHPQINTPAE